MAFNRILIAPSLKKIIVFASLFLLLLPLFSCSFKKQVAIDQDFSSQGFHASWLVDEDTFSAIANIDLTTPEGFYPVKAALIIKKPSYLRLELLPVIGVPDFMLTATPEKINIFIPSRREFYNGLPTASNLKKFLPWSMEIEDIVMILSGTYPSFEERDISYREFQEENLWCLEMKAQSGSSLIIGLSGNNKLQKLIRKNDTGKELYNVEYVYNDNHSNIADKIIIKMGDGKTSLSVKYSDVKIEKSEDLSVFNLVIPPNVKSINLE